MKRRRSYVNGVGAVLALSVSAICSGCMVSVWRTEPHAINPVAVPDTANVQVKSIVKVHLRDGSTVLYRDGASLSRTRIAGVSWQYQVMSAAPTTRGAVPMDSVVAVEVFDQRYLATRSLLLSVSAIAVGVFAYAEVVLHSFAWHFSLKGP